MRSPAQKAIMIGIDGASMELVLNQARWGNMPNVATLLSRGVHRPMIGTFPTLTPPGWTALYSGSWHSTHKIMDFTIRAVGQPLNETLWGINTQLSQSEYLWNTAERAGKTPLLVKVEMSWPPTIKKGIQIEGTGPGVSNHHQIAGYHLFVTGQWKPRPIGGVKDSESVDPSALQEDVPYDPISTFSATSWENLPPSSKPCLEFPITIQPLKRGRENMLRGQKGNPKLYYGLIFASKNQGYDRIRICQDQDGDTSLSELQVGVWSSWHEESFVIDGREITGNLRFKLITLTPEADTIELFIPQIWPTEGYSYPSGVASQLYQHLGPFLQNPARDVLGLIDDNTYFELLEYHHQHLADIAQELTTRNRWDILFTETHASDYGDHFFIGQADMVEGLDSSIYNRCREGLARTYSSIDRWIGRIMQLADDETVIVIASDHGGTSTRYHIVEVNDVLAKAGLLVYSDENKTIDWSQTRAAGVGRIHVFMNLQGRDPGGIVLPQEYETTQREIIDALLDYRDPMTNHRPFTLALQKKYAEILNLWGDRVGDVVYGIHPNFDGAHGNQLPVGQHGISGQHSTFIMAGPGVKQDVALERSVRVIDVAPTLCHLLGWPMPRNVEGGIIYEALEDPDWYIQKRAS